MQCSHGAPRAVSSDAAPPGQQAPQPIVATAGAADRVQRYGVYLQTPEGDAVDHTVETIRLLGAVLGPNYASDSAVRRLLGYELGVPTSVEVYYTKRRRVLGV